MIKKKCVIPAQAGIYSLVSLYGRILYGSLVYRLNTWLKRGNDIKELNDA